MTPAIPHDPGRLAAAREAVLASVLEAVDRRDPLVVLRAPPGSGKTWTIERAVALAWHRGLRVAVATQTNAQADDLAARLAASFPKLPVWRFASSGYQGPSLGDGVQWIFEGKELPEGRGAVVAVAAKWGATRELDPFDLLVVDEAWQLAWADLMLLHKVAPRFVLVGDPGQIEPVVTVDTRRWETSPRPPHRAAPDVILRDESLGARVLSLPVSTRLPHDTVRLVRSFYDFPFEAWSAPGARRVEAGGPSRAAGVDGAVDLLRTGSVALLTLPTPADGPALEDDRELAVRAADVARRLLERHAEVVTEEGRRPLVAGDIGMVAAHRVTNGRIQEALGALAGEVRVDTPERWQGLERPVMIAVHPLSGVLRPSAFDLSTGRLCVMTSRHRVGLVIVARDHVGASLDEYAPSADQAPGVDDGNGRGHARHVAVWRWLHDEGVRAEDP